MAILKRVVPAVVALALIALAVYQLIAQSQVECMVCVRFNNLRECATASAPDEPEAREAAHRSACSLMTSGVSDAFACPRVAADEVRCKAR